MFIKSVMEWFNYCLVFAVIIGVGGGGGGINAGSIQPNTRISVMHGEGFIAYLQLGKSFGPVVNCKFYYQTDLDATELPLNATTPIVTSRGEQVLPYTTDICGIRVNGITSSTQGRWQLEASNAYDDIELDAIEVNVLTSTIPPSLSIVQRSPGDGYIACTTHATYNRHCHIFDMQLLTHHPNICTLSTRMQHNAQYECRTYDWGRMEAARERIKVQLVAPNDEVFAANATVEITGTRLTLRCQFDESINGGCLASMPDNQQELLIMDGLYNGGRYSTADTKISDAHCALELQSPLQSHEIGLWRIHNYRIQGQPPSGCLYYVGQSPTTIIEETLASQNQQEQQQQRQLRLYSDNRHIDIIDCWMPFVIEQCYLKAPNNSLYFMTTTDLQRGASHGHCVFRQLPLLPGNWTCGVRPLDNTMVNGGGGDVLQQIEVFVQDRDGYIDGDPVVWTNISEKQQLLCHTAYEAAASRCAFIDPMGNVYLVAIGNDGEQQEGRIRYYGRGLSYGDCGIHIDEINMTDFGIWRCQFAVSGSLRSDSIFEIELRANAGENVKSWTICILFICIINCVQFTVKIFK